MLALDYLLLTQGWRRLGWEKIRAEAPVAMRFKGERAVTSGLVLDKNGNPVPRMKVLLDGSDRTALTDATGRFEFDTLLPAGVLVRVEHPRLSGYAGRTRGGWQEVNIRLPLLSHSYEERKQTAIFLQDASKVGPSKLQGTVTDAATGDPLIFATVAVYQNGVLRTGTETDLDGFYSLTELEPGNYDLEFSYTGYSSQRISDVMVEPSTTEMLDAGLSGNMELAEVVVTYEAPIIEQDNTSQGAVFDMGRQRGGGAPARRPRQPKREKQKAAQPAATVFSKEQIKDLPTRDVNGLVALGAGVADADELAEVQIRGSRANATNFFLDGVRVNDSMVPMQRFEQLQPIQGGVDARFGHAADMEEDFASERLVANRSVVVQDAVEAPVVMGFVQQKKDLAPMAEVRLQREFYSPRNFPVPNYEASSAANRRLSRTDFRKTIFWKPDLRTDKDGKATIRFFVSDAITTFRATVEGIGESGNVGRGEQRFFTQMPFSMDAKLPVNLLTGDRLAIPVTLTNNTDGTLEGGLQVAVPAGFVLLKKWPDYIQLSAGESKTFYPEYEIGIDAGGGTVSVNFSTQGLEDTFEKNVKVQPRGFPVRLVMGGNEREKTFEFDVTELVEGSLSASFQVYPSVLEELATSLERMLRQPGGCFEQTSSSNYPNLLVLNFLQQSGNANPDLEKKAMDFLDYGYKRLLTFEIPSGGFDWFGKPPAHEALSAYGLMEFVDMQAVYPVEQAVIDRTAKWLLTRRDGQGGWQSSKQGLHSWQRPGPIADAYITWAMTEAGYGQQVLPEAEKTLRDATETADPYLLALAANILLNLDDQRAEKVLAQLLDLQAEDGSWTGLTHSMTHSTGKNLTVETTALAVAALLKNENHLAAVRRSVDYLVQAKTEYGYGSTQATVLALRALVEHAKSAGQAPNPGEVALFVNGQKMDFGQDESQMKQGIQLDSLGQYLAEGRNEVKVRFANADATLPYDLSVNYATRQPKNSEACKVQIQTQLNTQNSPLKTGETVRLTTRLTNRSTEAVPNPIAIVGIPAGLSVQPWQVKQLQERGVCDFYEIKGSQLVIYFRQMEGEEVKQIHLDLKADLPGSFEAPASMTYLYYSNDAVTWSKPERVVVAE